MLPQLVPLILFGIAAGFSPGPNNIVTSHSAFNFGFKKTIPTMLGVISGWTLLSIILVFGAGIIFKKFEELQIIIKILGSVYLIFLAYKISFNRIKKKHNIPLEMQSCHTTILDKYFIEGHVPIEAINKLLKEQPDIDGIALPGMPIGTPGMPGEKEEPYIIYQLVDGKSSVFMTL